MPFTRESIAKQFKENQVLVVSFFKADGSVRIMRCTTDLSLVPEDKHPKGEQRAPSEITHTVWEMGVGWRSFKYEKIIEVGA